MSVRLHLFKSKIHRAIVTHADLDYEGSMTFCGSRMDAAGIHEHVQIIVWFVTRVTGLITYALRGEQDSKIMCMNGAAAHLMKPGDRVIVATFAEVPAEDAATWEPTVVLVNDDNEIVDPKLAEVAGPKRRVTA
jgi:aspartate 1-decarboxylase